MKTTNRVWGEIHPQVSIQAANKVHALVSYRVGVQVWAQVRVQVREVKNENEENK
jgi:hypothetical protein